MPLPGMRGTGEPPQPPPLSEAAKTLREAEIANGFEGKLIFAANAAVVLLVVTVIFFTLLTAGPDKPPRKQRKEKGGDAAAAPKGKDGRYTAAEVAKHSKPTDCWVIIKGKVYDITSYVDEHPGGEAILRNAGADSTVGFMGPQHPTRVYDILDDFLIGTLAETSKDK